MNFSIETAAHFAQGWLHTLGRASLEGGIALLLVWFVCRFVTWLPARVKCWLWRLAYLKLAIALVWDTPVELRVLRTVRTMAAEPVSVRKIAIAPVDGPASANTVITPPPPPARSHALTSSDLPDPRLGFVDRLTLAAFCVWSAVVIVLLLRLGIQWQVAARLRGGCSLVLEESVQRECAMLARRLGLRTCPPVVSSDSVHSPLLLGILRPVIVVPAAMLAVPADRLRLMLSHELAHLARRDLPWNLFATVLEALFFFHPLVWLARRENRLAQEIAADEMALALTSASPATYGQALLDVASRGWAPRLPLAAGVVTSRKTLERRLIAMRNLPHWSRRNLAVIGVGMAFGAVVALPPWKLVAQQAPPQATTRPSVNAAQTEQPIRKSAIHVFAVTNTFCESNFNVQAITDGFVREIHGTVGEVVHKGDLVLVMDDRKQKVNLELAKLKLAQSRLEHDQIMRGVETKIYSNFDLSKVQLALQVAEIEVASNQNDLDDTRVFARGSGWLQYAQHPVGEYVMHGTKVAEIAAFADECTFTVPKTILPQLKIGQKIEYRSGRGVLYSGQVITVPDPKNIDGATSEVTARFANESDVEAQDGEVTVHLAE